jgi:formylglycine-generating enzyme required for sulfatase activity
LRDFTRLVGDDTPALRVVARSPDGTKVTYEFEAEAGWQESKEFGLVATDRAGNPTRVHRLYLLKAENLPRFDHLEVVEGACIEVDGVTSAVTCPEIRLVVINRTEEVNRVTARIDDLPAQDLDPLERRFIGQLLLPVTQGDFQEFRITLRCFGGSPPGEEFATRKVLYDVRPPLITLLVAEEQQHRLDEVIEVDRIDNLRIRITDPSGVDHRSVRYHLSRSGGAAGPSLLPQHQGQNEYALHPLRAATSEIHDVAFFAEDRLGNALTEPFRFRIKVRMLELDPQDGARLASVVEAAAGPASGLPAAMEECDRLLRALREVRESARRSGVAISSEVDPFLRRIDSVGGFLQLRTQEPADRATARQRYLDLIGTPELPERLRSLARIRAEDLRAAVAVAPPVRPLRPEAERPSLASYQQLVNRRVPGTGMQLVPITRNPMASGDAPVFFLGRTEVTVEQFWPFAQAWERDHDTLLREITDSRGAHNPHGIRWRRRDTERLKETMTAAIAENRHILQEGKPKEPARYISRYVAAAYASWLGGRLPTEIEWKGAAGHFLDPTAEWIVHHRPGRAPESDKRRFPTERKWAMVGDHSRGRVLPVDELEPHCLFGLVGMAGNVSEWVLESPGTLRSAGTLGGSYRHRHDNRAGCQLDRDPYRENDTDVPSIPDVGFRVLWPMEQ